MSRVKEAFQKLLHPINNWVEWHPSRSDAALGLVKYTILLFSEKACFATV